MGKVVTYLTILIMIDLFFIATGQICNDGIGCSLGSIILNSILNIQNVTELNFFTELIGSIGALFTSTTGLGSIILGTTVFLGALALVPTEQRLFIPMAFSLALLVSDFVFIGAYLISLNALLGTFIIAPLAILYVFTVVEWLRGKD
ncbi:hypothetical protein LCGC14_2762900 [marine sediment metagenome]|uniref:Uncharacterized protein n=1 Tax=marine sediment metagenome TaxID=412755 RepID=A0A0F8YYE0_9ZZZZ